MNNSEPYVSLIIPAYNEQGRIAETICKAKTYLDSLNDNWELIVVDDGSTDSTLDAVASCPDELSRLRVISYRPNRGKGYAVRQGVTVSRGHFVGFSDADLSAPLAEFSKLFAAIEKGFDVAIGSRAVKGAEISIHQPLYRELGGKLLNLIIQLLATPGIRDTQCGFKLFLGEVAREIFGMCFVDRWGFDVEVLYLARRLGYKIAEIGIKWSHAPSSSIRPFRAALGVIRDIIRMRAHRY